MSKFRNDRGSGPVELFVVILVLIVGIFTIWNYYENHSKTAGPSPTPSPGWLTYRSDQTSISFSYPDTWTLSHPDAGAQTSYMLDDVLLRGPNGFQMQFLLQKNHVNPALSCASWYRHAPVVLNADYVMVPEGSSADQTAKVVLMSTDMRDQYQLDRGCVLEYYPNPLTGDTGFTFIGNYAGSKVAGDFLARPEVKTAKAIFASFKH